LISEGEEKGGERTRGRMKIKRKLGLGKGREGVEKGGFYGRRREKKISSGRAKRDKGGGSQDKLTRGQNKKWNPEESSVEKKNSKLSARG